MDLLFALGFMTNVEKATVTNLMKSRFEFGDVQIDGEESVESLKEVNNELEKMKKEIMIKIMMRGHLHLHRRMKRKGPAQNPFLPRKIASN